jgi:NDP-sugar pyrophosphorylase family protein
LKGILLAAGFGTRLAALSDELPKPLLPLCDVPLIRYGIRLLRDAGISEIAVNLHHLGGRIRAELGEDVVYSDEPEILGTGGGVKRMAERLGGDRFVVVNAKVAVDLDLRAVLDEHARGGSEATMVVRPDPDARRWGAVDVDAGGTVRAMLGAGATMFTGVHVLERAFVGRIPAGVCDIVRTAYAAAVPIGRVRAHVMPEGAFFAENSTPKRYLDANLALLDGAWRPPWPATGVDPSAVVDPGAVLERPIRVGAAARVETGARVARSVVGRGARIAPGAHLDEVVVCAGASAAGVLRGAIVTPSGRIVDVR